MDALSVDKRTATVARQLAEVSDTEWTPWRRTRSSVPAVPTERLSPHPWTTYGQPIAVSACSQGAKTAAAANETGVPIG